MDLVVDDDCIRNRGSYLAKQYEAMGEYIDEYVNILNEILQSGIKKGEIHNALQTFRDQIYIGNGTDGYSSVRQIGEFYQVCSKNYIAKLDTIDGDLY